MIEVAFQGRLGREPEFRRVKGGGLALLSFGACVEGKDENPDAPRWVRVAVFGDQAEQLDIAKGDRVYVEGKLSLEQFEGRDGKMRAHLNVVATLVQPMGQIGRRRPSQLKRPPASIPPPRPGFVEAWSQEPSETPFFDDVEAAVADLNGR